MDSRATSPALSSMSTSESLPRAGSAARVAAHSGRMRSSGDDEDGGRNKRKRKTTRELEETPVVGVGRCDGESTCYLLDHFPTIESKPRMYMHRKDLKRKEDGRKPAPFGDDSYIRWVENREEQLAFAQVTAVPLYDDIPLRRLAGEDHDTVVENETSKALFAAKMMHGTTLLDYPMTPQVKNICMPQWHGDIESTQMRFGLMGGLAGTDWTCFWHVGCDDGLLSTESHLLQLQTFLAVGLNGMHHGTSQDPIWPACNTGFTELIINPTRKRIEGGRYITAGDNLARALRQQHSTSEDICAPLAEGVKAYRQASCIDNVVPPERHITDPKLTATPLSACMEDPKEHSTMNLFEMQFYVDAFAGVDDMGNKRFVKISCIRVRNKIPGVDVVVAVKQLLRVFPEMTNSFMQVMRHMQMNMSGRCDMSVDSLFDLNTKDNVCALTTEANIPFATFRCAHVHKVLLGTVWGMRIDIDDPADVATYKKYLGFLYNNRASHFELVLKEVINDIVDGVRAARQPVEEFPLQLGISFHYRSISWDELHSMLEEHVKLQYVEGRGWSESHWSEQVESLRQHLLMDENNVYIPFAGSPMTSGVLMAIDHCRFSVEIATLRKKNKTGDDCTIETMLQPCRVAPIVEIYLSSMNEDFDQFSCLFTENCDIVLDFDFLSTAKQLNVTMQRMSKHLQPIDFETMMTSRHLMYERDLMQLYGQTINPMHGELSMVCEKQDLDELARTHYTTFLSGYRQATNLMLSGELVQLEKAAHSICDLYKQNRFGCEYMQQFQKFLQNNDDCFQGFDDFSNSVWFKVREYSDLKLGVTWCNSMLTGELLNASMSIFCYSSSFWGATVWLSDMGQSSKVLVMDVQNQWRKTRRPIVKDDKAPSMGADAVNHSNCQLSNAYGEFLITHPRLSDFYKSGKSKDTTNLWASAMSLATMLGSGIQTIAGRVEGTRFKEEMGLCCIFAEAMKVQAHTEAAESFITEVESQLGHSGKQGDMIQQSWTSTRGFEGVDVKQMYSIPMLMLCSNRQLKRAPRSILDGGRVKVVNTSVFDGDIGTIHSNSTTQQVEFNTNLRGMDWREDQREPIHRVTSETAQAHRLYFLIRHLERRAFPFVHRVLTLGFKSNELEPSLTSMSIYQNVLRITKGLVRPYLTSEETFSRTYRGPFETSTRNPIWAQMNITRCAMAGVLRAYKLEDDRVRVNLVNSFVDSLQHTLMAPVNLVCIFSALYTWISQTVLDANIMVLVCHFLAISGLQQHCPLHVLASACLDLPLTPVEETQYDVFCNFLLPIVTCKTSIRTNASSLREWKTQPRNRLVAENSLTELPGDEDVAKHCTSGAENDAATLQCYQERVYGKLSGYVRPSVLNVAEKPSFITDDNFTTKSAPADEEEDDQRNKKRTKMTFTSSGWRDEYVIASSNLKLAQMYADQQGPEGQEVRNRASHIPGFNKAAHSQVDFWNAAVNGCRLPRQQRQSGDQVFDLKFDSVERTGFWFVETMKNAGSMTGPIRQFVTLCGLDENCSRRILLQKILQRFLAKHPEMEREVVNNQAWNKPIFVRQNDDLYAADDAFGFNWAPFVDPHTHRVSDSLRGIEVSLCMDIVALIVGQGLFCHEWRPVSSTSNRSVVHLRNMGHATHTLLLMMMHTMISKSVIPAGHIYLQHLDPMCATRTKEAARPVEIPYINLLHTDSMPQNRTYVYKLRNILSGNQRVAKALLCKLGDEEFNGETSNYMVLRRLQTNTNSMLVKQTAHGMFPFPPEAFAHMHSHMGMILVAFQRFAKSFHSKAPDLPLCLRTFGLGVSERSVMHHGSSLTKTFEDPNIEVPCMTYRHGMLFVFSHTEDNDILLAPVTPTHHELSDVIENGDLEEWRSLPLVDNYMQVPSLLLSYVMSSGLVHNNDGMVEFRPPSQHNGAFPEQSNTLSAMPFPIILWDHLVFVRQYHRTVNAFTEHWNPAYPNAHRRVLRIVDIREAWSMTESYFADEQGAARWKKSYFDIPPLSDPRDKLVIVDIHGVWAADMSIDDIVEMNAIEWAEYYNKCESTHFWIVRTDESSNHVQKFYFNSCQHLKQTLMRNDGKPCSDDFILYWRFCDQLVARTTVYNPFDIEKCVTFYPLVLDTDNPWQNLTETGFALTPLNPTLSFARVAMTTFVDESRGPNARHLINLTKRLNEMVNQKRYLTLSSVADDVNAESRLQMQTGINVLQGKITELEGRTNEVKNTMQSSEITTLTPKRTHEAWVGVGKGGMDTKFNLSPPLRDIPWKKQDDSTLAMIVPQCIVDSGPKYLCDGRYRIKGVYGADNQMDFMNASRCIVPEGTAMFLRLSPRVRSDIEALDPKIGLPPDSEDKTHIEVYYVLGASSTDHLVVKLCIKVYEFFDGELGYQGPMNNGNITVMSRVFDDHSDALLSLKPDLTPDKNVGHLIRYAGSAGGGTSHTSPLYVWPN